jgi:ceramide glucosyltransferase
VTVATDVIEPTFATLWQRETRWLRTIRSVNRPGFASLFITFTTPWLLAGALLALYFQAGSGAALHPFAATAMALTTIVGLIARVTLHARSARHSRSFWRDLPLVPLRDILLGVQWFAAAFGSNVVWRGERVPVDNRVAQPRPGIMKASDGR